MRFHRSQRTAGKLRARDRNSEAEMCSDSFESIGDILGRMEFEASGTDARVAGSDPVLEALAPLRPARRPSQGFVEFVVAAVAGCEGADSGHRTAGAPAVFVIIGGCRDQTGPRGFDLGPALHQAYERVSLTPPWNPSGLAFAFIGAAHGQQLQMDKSGGAFPLRQFGLGEETPKEGIVAESIETGLELPERSLSLSGNTAGSAAARISAHAPISNHPKPLG